jgi:hypothetical protein
VITGNPAIGVAVGGQLLSGAMGADSAKKAAEQQAAATQEAQARTDALYQGSRDEARRVYETSTAAFQPYINLGHGVVPTLGSMVGLSPTAAPSAATPVPGLTPSEPSTLGAIVERSAPRSAVERGGEDVGKRAARATASGYGGAGGRAVLVKAPTGELSWANPVQAERYVAAGAQIVEA